MHDIVNNVLEGGLTVTIIKGPEGEGSSLGEKVGTKAKNIRLVEGDHDIDCSINGVGAMKLKREFEKSMRRGPGLPGSPATFSPAQTPPTARE